MNPLRFKKREQIASRVAGYDELIFDRDNDCFYFVRHENFKPDIESVTYLSYQDAIDAYWSGWITWHPAG